MTKTSMWYGVLPGGACGMFDPAQTKPYVKPEKPLSLVACSLSPHPSRSSARSIRSSLLRTDVKRHTYTGKRTIQRSMISSPQGDVKHTGHVGLDGAYFGDIPFLDPAGCPPRQIVTPYKPSEDLEQVPLINPNSPSHLTGASCSPPYPLLSSSRSQGARGVDEMALPCETKMRSLKKQSHKISEPTTSKSILNKVKCATFVRGRSSKAEDAAAKTDEVHEYHEISDTDTESTATDHPRAENLVLPDSPGIPKSYGDFSQSLLDEMEFMFRSLDGRRRDETGTCSKHFDIDSAMRSHTLSKNDKKKGFYTGTMKPMSAHDEKTLETAVALANELTTRSMTDLESDAKVPSSPSDRSKFHFKFPSLHHSTSHEGEKDSIGKHERRNFSEEAQKVPDIQATITEESKLAYTSLIEQPTPSSSLISHIAKDASGLVKPGTIPKPAPRASKMQFHSLQKPCTSRQMPTCSNVIDGNRSFVYDNKNELPLPPRASKPKLVDKPRHIRKYPLKIPPPTEMPAVAQPIIYQNAVTCPKFQVRNKFEIAKNGIDVFDGPSHKVDTNPFKFTERSSANPFDRFLEAMDSDGDDEEEEGAAEPEEGESLVRDCIDHVSVEDLLEFADQKPCGRQRGVESDEVRIMCKVLKNQVTPVECLEALELSEWNVHLAIKTMRVRLSVGGAELAACCAELANARGDVTRASAALLRPSTHQQ